MIKFVQCDRCGAREQHVDGLASGWVPVGWCEIYVQDAKWTDRTKHACPGCTAVILLDLTGTT